MQVKDQRRISLYLFWKEDVKPTHIAINFHGVLNKLLGVESRKLGKEQEKNQSVFHLCLLLIIQLYDTSAIRLDVGIALVEVDVLHLVLQGLA